jgi:hypothetical protein
MGVRKWEREAWEKEVAELANGGKQVVTMNAGESAETQSGGPRTDGR